MTNESCNILVQKVGGTDKTYTATFLEGDSVVETGTTARTAVCRLLSHQVGPLAGKEDPNEIAIPLLARRRVDGNWEVGLGRLGNTGTSFIDAVMGFFAAHAATIQGRWEPDPTMVMGVVRVTRGHRYKVTLGEVTGEGETIEQALKTLATLLAVTETPGTTHITMRPLPDGRWVAEENLTGAGYYGDSPTEALSQLAMRFANPFAVRYQLIRITGTVGTDLIKARVVGDAVADHVGIDPNEWVAVAKLARRMAEEPQTVGITVPGEILNAPAADHIPSSPKHIPSSPKHIPSSPKPDEINAPAHYYATDGSGTQAIHVVEAFQLNFCRGNTVKYVLRAGRKEDAVKDLKKAIWYLQREIENMEKEQPNHAGAGN